MEIPSAVRENLAALIKELRAADASSSKNRARWVRPENLHVTLKFIGNVDADKLDAIRAALADVRSGGAAELRFCGLGFFPNEKRPRVLWAGIEASPNLATLPLRLARPRANFFTARRINVHIPHSSPRQTGLPHTCLT